MSAALPLLTYKLVSGCAALASRLRPVMKLQVLTVGPGFIVVGVISAPPENPSDANACTPDVSLESHVSGVRAKKEPRERPKARPAFLNLHVLTELLQFRPELNAA